MSEEKKHFGYRVGQGLAIASAGTAIGFTTYFTSGKNKGAGFGAGIGTAIAMAKNGDSADFAVYTILGGLLGYMVAGEKNMGPKDAFNGANAACDLCDKHPNGGLRWTPEHLKKIEKDIVSWSIKKQSEYADEVTREHVNEPARLGLFKPVRSPRRWNATSVGNLAYIALNSNNQLARDYSRGLLELFKKYKKGTI